MIRRSWTAGNGPSRTVIPMADSLIEKRQAIQHLLNPRSPADALASYYALYHPEDRTTLLIHRSQSAGKRGNGFLALCRTGMDLFRPLLTLRVPDEQAAAELLESALPAEAAVMIAVPPGLRPIVEAFFSLAGETTGAVYQLERHEFRPIINVLVVQAPSPDGSPRFVIRGQSFDRGARSVGPAVATAGINWRSPYFADIYVHVDPQARGREFGKSVVSALSNWLLGQNITPLYTAPDTDEASAQLAAGLGFRDTGVRILFCDGIQRATFPFRQSMVE
jgi:RimJ/RimL family protein N-acetyltransferase